MFISHARNQNTKVDPTGKAKEFLMNAVGLVIAMICVFSAGFFLPTACSGPVTYHIYKTSIGIVHFNRGHCLNGLFVNYDSVNLLDASGLPVTCIGKMLKVDAYELDRLEAIHGN